MALTLDRLVPPAQHPSKLSATEKRLSSTRAESISRRPCEKGTAYRFMVAAVVGVMALVACNPSDKKSGDGTQFLTPTKDGALCNNNLRLMDDAKLHWASEHQKATNDPATTWDDLREYIGRGESNSIVPECPCGGIYIIGRLDVAAKCSLKPGEHTYDRERAHKAKTNRNQFPAQRP